MLLSKNKLCAGIFCVVICVCLSARAENWPGYEGIYHQSSSPVEIGGTLTVAWERRFTNLSFIPSSTTWGITGYMHSRNLAYFNGMIAIAINSDPGYPDYPTRRAPLTILNAKDGTVVNCVTTAQYHGGYKNMYDATETGLGEQIVTWDPDTGIVFLSIGGDMPGHSAIAPLANAGSFTGAYQTGVGAYEELNNKHPGLRSSRNRARSEETSIHNASPPLPVDEWDSQNSYPNRCGFFDLQPGSPYMVICKGSAHEDAQADGITNKYTGLCAKENWAQYTYADCGFPIFKMWHGQLVQGDRIYYLGPYVAGYTPAQLCDATLGMQVACMQMIPTDNYENDGYTGPGAAETARPNPTKLFQYQYESPAGDGNAWNEMDNYYRNKAWLVQGDGVWIAWKPSTSSTVKLVRATTTENSSYDLGVGGGVVTQEVWPNIAYQNLGLGQEYIVYYLANAYSGSEYSPAPPNGPASLVIFDADARAVKWTYQLNNASKTGNYPDLPPNPTVLYFECSRLVVAGKYAYIAWVDSTGASSSNALLKLARFDITSPSAPTTPPAPFVYDLGIPAATNQGARVNDIIAVNGTLYVSVVEATSAGRFNFIDNQAQRVVAVRPAGQSVINVDLQITPSSGAARVVAVCDASGSTTTASSITTYEWDFSYDNLTFNVEATGAVVSHVFDAVGTHVVAVRVTDSTGRSEVRQASVTVTPDTAAPQSAFFDVIDEVCIRHDNDKSRMRVSGTYNSSTTSYGTVEHSRGYVQVEPVTLNPSYVIQEARLNFSITRMNNSGWSTVHRLAPGETLSSSSTWSQISTITGYDQDGNSSNGVCAPLGEWYLTAGYTGPKYFVVTDAVLAWLGRAPYSSPEPQNGFLLCVDDQTTRGTLETQSGYTTFYSGERDASQWDFQAGTTNLEIIYIDPSASTPKVLSGVRPGSTPGEVYSSVASLDIYWSGTGPVDFVDIEYSATSSTGPWTGIASNEPNDGSYTWNGPPPAATMWIRITEHGSPSVNAVSAYPFQVAVNDVTPPTVNVTACDLAGTVFDVSMPPYVTVAGTDVPVTGGTWSRSNIPVIDAVPLVITATDGSNNTTTVHVVIDY